MNVSLELGIQGVQPAHLRTHLRVAQMLGSPLLRTVFNVPGHAHSGCEAALISTELLPEFEAAGVKIAIETYEQVPTARVLEVIRRINHPRLGICSDPPNTVLNMHINDVAFSRQEGWIGFTYSCAPLAEGLLDYEYMVESRANTVIPAYTAGFPSAEPDPALMLGALWSSSPVTTRHLPRVPLSPSTEG